MSSIIFGPFRLLGNAQQLFWWPVWWRSCRPKVRIRQRVREKIQQISNLLLKRSKFEHCQIRMRTSSHPYYPTLIYTHPTPSHGPQSSCVTTKVTGVLSSSFSIGTKLHRHVAKGLASSLGELTKDNDYSPYTVITLLITNGTIVSIRPLRTRGYRMF